MLVSVTEISEHMKKILSMMNILARFKLVSIDNYIQVLLPVYRFSVFMQRNNCPIGEVVPALFILFEDLKRLQINGAPVTGTYALLRDLLIKSFQKKFAYE